jgi:ABC-type glycerol-3-phosphate transport system substrate-binding protein
MRLFTIPGILASAAFAAVLVGCGGQGNAKKEMTVLLRMMPAQERFFRDNVVKPFEKKHNCKINIATFNKQWDIERMLKLEAGKKNPEIGLVKTPFEMTRVLAGKGYMKKLSDAADSAQVAMDMAEYHPLAAGLGYIDQTPYYIPRKLETRILFYRKSKVTEAVEKFPAHRDRIDQQLEKENGYGLPAGYTLEADPNEWDFYDQYVVGAIWAAEEYNGVTMGRAAHRAARYEGTATFLVDRAFQLGAQKDDILRLTSDEVAEMFLWENMMIKGGIYNSGMWQDSWEGADIYNGVKDGKVYMAYFQQIDCFIVHGWEDDPGMPSYLPEKDDMGLAIAPKAVSFTIGDSGKPAWEGDRSLTVGGWWWGIPKTSPEPKLAYEFARHITSKDVQAEEIAKFGMIPVRKDILNNLPELFDEGWVGDIFQVSVEQIKLQLDNEKLVTAPLVKEYSEVARNYIDAWYTLCVEYESEQDGDMDLSTMKMRLASDFLEKQRQILAGSYPEQ